VSDTFRGFFALPVREQDKPALLDAARRMRPETGHLSARFIVADQLHVTLKFLGQVPRKHARSLIDIARRRAAEQAPFETRWTGVIAFGGVRRARHLVVGLDDPDGRMAHLADEIESDVEPLGVARDTRDFTAHVSLARLKRPDNATRALDVAKLELAPARFDELRLYESVLTRAGGVYSVLAAFPLSG
jgi:RNA 2',3'-cyclic 3'-phosphodiesterase